jgi:hypothetical protein
VRFLYGITLGRNTEALTASVPHMKHPIRRAEVYAHSEVEAILSAPSQLSFSVKSDSKTFGNRFFI